MVFVHLQGAWGGGLLMSRKHRHKLSGIERYVKTKAKMTVYHRKGAV